MIYLIKYFRIGTNQDNSPGLREGHGQVIIS